MYTGWTAMKSINTTLIASLLCREGKRAVKTSQEDKQSTNFKEEAIICFKKEKNYFPT